jgi:hypothetical protein
MIHTTLCAYVDNYMINLFSSFAFDEILLVFMTFKICNQIAHHVCIDERIAST